MTHDSKPADLERGVIYVVGGDEKYLREAAHSADTLRRHNPRLPIVLFTDIPIAEPERLPFDEVRHIGERIHPLKAKVKYLPDSPFRRTLFLDCDTEVRGTVEPVFEALADSDWAICHTPDIGRTGDGRPFFRGYEGEGFNTGVFAFRRSEPVEALLHRWHVETEGQDERDLWPGHNCDQCKFNDIVNDQVAEGLALRVLPNAAWNAREPVIPYLRREGRLDEVVIYHGRPRLSQWWKQAYLRPARWAKRFLQRHKLVSGSIRAEHLVPRWLRSANR